MSAPARIMCDVYSWMAFWTEVPVMVPASTRVTNLGHGCVMTFILFAGAWVLRRWWNFSPAMDASVARIPMVFDLVVSVAGFIAGSMPTNGMWNDERRDSTAWMVAELQAMTMMSTPFLMSCLERVVTLCCISVGDFAPYGQWLESAMYSMSAWGMIFVISSRTVSPPTPESRIPILVFFGVVVGDVFFGFTLVSGRCGFWCKKNYSNYES